MKNHFKKILFLILGIVLIPYFVDARSLSEAIDAKEITCTAGTSISKNSSATWVMNGLNTDFGDVSVSWSGSGIIPNSVGLQSLVETGYSSSVSDVIATLKDETGRYQVVCDALGVRDTNGGGGGSSDRCTLIGNIDGDIACDVDIFDFNLLMLNWGNTNSGNVADLNKDGIVGILDLNILMLNWTGTL